MTSKLSLYNNALRMCGERRLVSLAEEREPRRLLDDAYGDIETTGVVRQCLQWGQWTFATRAQELHYTPSVEPEWGYQRAFDQPTDWVRTTAICSDEFFTQPLLRYVSERGYWYADLDIIYIKYVSDHTDYGGDLSQWHEHFVNLVEASLAMDICGALTGADKEYVEKRWKQAKKDAMSGDAMEKPTAMLPPGMWNRARLGNSRNDRGSRSQLIG